MKEFGHQNFEQFFSLKIKLNNFLNTVFPWTMLDILSPNKGLIQWLWQNWIYLGKINRNISKLKVPEIVILTVQTWENSESGCTKLFMKRHSHFLYCLSNKKTML